MTSAIRLIPIVFIVTVAFLLSPSANLAAQSAREPLEGTRAFVYKRTGAVALDLQVLSPPPSFQGPRPAIVYFFGGGWAKGTVKQFLPFGQVLAERGMVCVFVDYRVASRHNSKPADSVEDAYDAMRYVRQHAAELRVDPKRIVAAGGSAGGHLALMTAVGTPASGSADQARPNLLIAYNPVTDLTEERWAGRFGSNMETISPLKLVRPGLPDTLIFHGAADTTVPIRQARDYCAAMKQAGAACTLKQYPEATHGFFNHGRHNNRWYTPVLAETISFLKTHGYVE